MFLTEVWLLSLSKNDLSKMIISLAMGQKKEKEGKKQQKKTKQKKNRDNGSAKILCVCIIHNACHEDQLPQILTYVHTLGTYGLCPLINYFVFLQNFSLKSMFDSSISFSKNENAFCSLNSDNLMPHLLFLKFQYHAHACCQRINTLSTR